MAVLQVDPSLFGMSCNLLVLLKFTDGYLVIYQVLFHEAAGLQDLYIKMIEMLYYLILFFVIGQVPSCPCAHG